MECVVDFPRPRRAAGTLSRGQIPRLGLQPLADVTGTLLTIGWPFLREAVVDHVVALDAERVSNDPGRTVAVVAVDRLLEKIAHGTPHYMPRKISVRRLFAESGPAAYAAGRHHIIQLRGSEAQEARLCRAIILRPPRNNAWGGPGPAGRATSRPAVF
jgi:hypothetical protein